MSDRELLQRFKETGSDAAFRALVDRYAGLVFSVALRRTGNRSVAEEVMQGVFVILAAKAAKLKTRGELAPWLHRTTLLEASNAARKEGTRQRKLEELVEMTRNDSDPQWSEVSPVLDEAIDQLKGGDRSAVLLRFYEELSFREVAATLGKTEAAARQQVSRALSKLSAILRRRGITTSATLLGAGMAGHLSGAVPATVVATISHGALTSAAGMSKASLFLNTINTMAYAKTKTAVAVALLAAIPIGLQWNENQKLKRGLSADDDGAAEVVSAKSGRRGGSEASGTRAGTRGKAAAVASVTGRMSRTPGASDWQRALFEQDPVLRSQRIAQLLANLDPKTAPGIAELFFGEGAEEGFESEARLFLRAWGQMDGRQAIDYLDEKGQAGAANASMLAALGGWATNNPQAARSWAESVEDAKLREDLLFGVIDGWALADFRAAADYAETRPRSEARMRFIELLFQRSMAAGGIAEAQNWFSGISDNDHNEIYKRRAFERIVNTMVLRDPSAAAHWISSQAGGEFVSQDAVQSTALRLAETSPEGALRWISSMSALDEGVSAGSQGRVIMDWGGREPEAAGHWLSANMDHPDFGVLAGRYSASVAGIDPQGAVEWARSIQDDRQREEALIGVARTAMRKGEEGMREELLLAGLTEEQMAQAASGMRNYVWGNQTMRGVAFREFDQALAVGGLMRGDEMELMVDFDRDGGQDFLVTDAGRFVAANAELEAVTAQYNLSYLRQTEYASVYGQDHPAVQEANMRLNVTGKQRDVVLDQLRAAEEARVQSIDLVMPTPEASDVEAVLGTSLSDDK